MIKLIRSAAGALTLAGALGTTLLGAPAASAAVAPPVGPPAFACPAGSDTYNVPNRIVGPNMPALAGTVCVFAGTTAFRSVHTEGGWRIEVKDGFGSKTTNVRFYEPVLNGKAEVLTQNGRIVVKA
jgi:hypothetical protein